MLQQEFQRILTRYANMLTDKLPKPSKTGDQYSLGHGDVVASMACYVANTAEYCADTVPQLEDMVRDRIDPEFAERVDMEDQQDAFYDTINACVRVIASGLEGRINPYLEGMAKMPWATYGDVGDQSAYVETICTVCQELMPMCKEILSEDYYRSLCDTFAASFLGKYLKAIYKCKRINENGAQQLLLDTSVIKTLFMQLRFMEPSERQAAQTNSDPYTRMVLREIGKIEGLLKLISTPSARLAESFPLLCPDGTAEDLAALMELKGMKRQDQQVAQAALASRSAARSSSSGATPQLSTGGLSAAAAASKKKRTGMDFWSMMSQTKSDMTTSLGKAKSALTGNTGR